MAHNPADDFRYTLSDDWTALTLAHPQYTLTITQNAARHELPYYTASVLLDGVQVLSVAGRLVKINGNYRIQYGQPTNKGVKIRLKANHQRQLTQIYETMTRHMEWVELDLYLPRLALAAEVSSYNQRIKRLMDQIDERVNELARLKSVQEAAAQKLSNYRPDPTAGR
jgi:hypothetical protein